MKQFLMALTIMSTVLLGPQALKAQDLGRGFNAYQSGDFATALKEWKPLAEQGNAFAQFSLGLMYHDGEGVIQDYAEAIEWYRKAAEQGLANAQYNLGLMYQNGEGVTQDYAEAMKLYRKAAEQGNVGAQYDLGAMYLIGYRSLQDVIAAHVWLNIAAANGKTHAAENRDRVAKLLSAADIVKAQQMAKRCMNSGYKDCGQ